MSIDPGEGAGEEGLKITLHILDVWSLVVFAATQVATIDFFRLLVVRTVDMVCGSREAGEVNGTGGLRDSLGETLGAGTLVAVEVGREEQLGWGAMWFSPAGTLAAEGTPPESTRVLGSVFEIKEDEANGSGFGGGGGLTATRRTEYGDLARG